MIVYLMMMMIIIIISSSSSSGRHQVAPHQMTMMMIGKENDDDDDNNNNNNNLADTKLDQLLTVSRLMHAGITPTVVCDFFQNFESLCVYCFYMFNSVMKQIKSVSVSTQLSLLENIVHCLIEQPHVST